MKHDEIVKQIFDAIRRMNELREPQEQLVCAEETALFGPGGSLDSLGLVSLILDVEEEVNAKMGTHLILADERAVSLKRNPFRDVRSLADYVVARLEEGGAC